MKISVCYQLLVLFQGFIFSFSKSCEFHDLEATLQPQKLKSPYYPATFPAQTQCTWTIKSRAGSRIRISFMFFDLLNPSSLGECAVQSLVLENGWKKADDPGKSFVLCGKKNPGTLVSEGHILRLTLHSDAAASKGRYKGFLINYISTTDLSNWPDTSGRNDANNRIVNLSYRPSPNNDVYNRAVSSSSSGRDLGGWTPDAAPTERRAPPPLSPPSTSYKSTSSSSADEEESGFVEGKGRKRGEPLPKDGRFVPARKRLVITTTENPIDSTEKTVRRSRGKAQKKKEQEGTSASTLIASTAIVVGILLLVGFLTARRCVEKRREKNKEADKLPTKAPPVLQPKPPELQKTISTISPMPTFPQTQFDPNTAFRASLQRQQSSYRPSENNHFGPGPTSLAFSTRTGQTISPNRTGPHSLHRTHSRSMHRTQSRTMSRSSHGGHRSVTRTQSRTLPRTQSRVSGHHRRYNSAKERSTYLHRNSKRYSMRDRNTFY